MKTFNIAALFFVSTLFVSCNQSSNPTSSQFRNPGMVVSTNGYGESLDSSYYKVWSDSSWQKFYKDTTINGTTYRVILDDVGNENLYGPNGYSGFGQDSGAVIVFDSALASLPDSIAEGTAYVSQTTFSYLGAQYVLTDQEALLDTATVTMPFGTFPNCLVMQSIGAINGNIQYAMTYWIAKGPSDIVRQDYSGFTVLMAYGIVNGQRWGLPPGGAMPYAASFENGVGSAGQIPATTAARTARDMQALAPAIIRGIVPFRR